MNITIPPKTLKQRVEQIERMAEIGFKGELFVLEQERKKLQDQNLLVKNYHIHVSRESDFYGYDILSKDEVGNDIYIELKSTTKREGDFKADMFYLSNNEYQMFLKNKKQYKLYRVYDIEGSPNFREFNIDDLKLTPDGYIVNCR